MQNLTTHLNLLFLSIVAMMLLSLSSPLNAKTKEQQVIDSAVLAYGGEKLLSLKNLKYTDNLYQFFTHQSGHSLQGPKTQHLNQIRIEVFRDWENQRSELKRLTKLVVGYHDRRNLTATHRIYKQGKGYNIDHFLEEYQESSRIDINNADLGYSQMLDPLVIKKLFHEKNQAKWVDTAFIQGKAHDVLTINANKPNEYSVYIDANTGFLSRMLQRRGTQLRSYDFSQHQHIDGIAWAKELFVGTQEQPIYHSTNRQISVNLSNASGFGIPASYQVSAPVSPVDVSKLTLRQLAHDVYYVGQGWGYTLFVDAGEYYISAGAWGMSDRSDDWQQALNLLHKTTSNEKSVKYHLVSHHHTDHMSELHDVLKHGAKIILHPSDVNSVRAFLNERKINDDKFKSIEHGTALANGKIQIVDVPSSQASHNLAIYLPEHKIIFAEDIFGSSYQKHHHSPRSWPHMDTYQRLAGFTQRLEKLGLDVNKYVSSHHARILSQKDIDEALKISLPKDETIIERLFSGS